MTVEHRWRPCLRKIREDFSEGMTQLKFEKREEVTSLKPDWERLPKEFDDTLSGIAT